MVKRIADFIEHGPQPNKSTLLLDAKGDDLISLHLETILSANERVIVLPNGDWLLREKVLEEAVREQIDGHWMTTLAFDEIPEGICVVDKYGIVRVWNKEIEEVYGLKADEILGRYLHEFFPEAANVQVLESRVPIRDKKHRPRAGTDILISASPIYKNGELQGVVSTDRRFSDVLNLSKQLNAANHFINILEKKIDQEGSQSDDFFVGENPRIREQIEIAVVSAKTDVPIMLQGETGTGKEVFSRFIHKKSGLEGDFVAVNCSAVPENLFESEFFGYVKGAFTGADNQGRKGYLEQANNGTLFLDEVSELPLLQQTKLLRAIQEGKIRPLGGDKDISVNIRLISASNEDLEEMVKRKEFRIDLYYRLKGIMIHIPPLRERHEDLESIIAHFSQEVSQAYNPRVRGISLDAMDVLKRYTWPGNVRELKNVLRQMVVMAKGDELDKEDIPSEIKCEVLGECDPFIDAPEELTLQERVENYEREIVKTTLMQTGGNIAKASSLLGVPRTTLQYKIKKYAES